VIHFIDNGTAEALTCDEIKDMFQLKKNPDVLQNEVHTSETKFVYNNRHGSMVLGYSFLIH
jgi:hypothetical protein